MASYDLTRYTTAEMDSIDEALEAVQTKLNLIDATKVIRMSGVVPLQRDRQRCVGYVLYDT